MAIGVVGARPPIMRDEPPVTGASYHGGEEASEPTELGEPTEEPTENYDYAVELRGLEVLLGRKRGNGVDEEVQNRNGIRRWERWWAARCDKDAAAESDTSNIFGGRCNLRNLLPVG